MPGGMDPSTIVALREARAALQHGQAAAASSSLGTDDRDGPSAAVAQGLHELLTSLADRVTTPDGAAQQMATAHKDYCEIEEHVRAGACGERAHQPADVAAPGFWTGGDRLSTMSRRLREEGAELTEPSQRPEREPVDAGPDAEHNR